MFVEDLLGQASAEQLLVEIIEAYAQVWDILCQTKASQNVIRGDKLDNKLWEMDCSRLQC